MPPKEFLGNVFCLLVVDFCLLCSVFFSLKKGKIILFYMFPGYHIGKLSTSTSERKIKYPPSSF